MSKTIVQGGQDLNKDGVNDVSESLFIEGGMIKGNIIGQMAIGGSGAMAKVDIEIEQPIAPLLAPLKSKLVDPLAQKIKDLIPGNFEDAMVDAAAKDLVDFIVAKLSE